jgi:hypothetical protein
LDVSLGQHSNFHTGSTAEQSCRSWDCSPVSQPGVKLHSRILQVGSVHRSLLRIQKAAEKATTVSRRQSEKTRKAQGNRAANLLRPTNFHHLPLRRCIDVCMPSDWDLAGDTAIFFSAQSTNRTSCFGILKISSTNTAMCCLLPGSTITMSLTDCSYHRSGDLNFLNGTCKEKVPLRVTIVSSTIIICWRSGEL